MRTDSRTASATADGHSVGFVRYAWAFAAYLLAVILFGAWVRISGSGAGCGDHWPLCNGELVPRGPSGKTIVEYTHRVTSGLTGPLALGLVWGAWRRYRARPGVLRAAVVTLVFILLEAGIGAGLVLKELVASDASVARAIVIALHLLNTYGLMAAVTLCAYWAGGETAAPVEPPALRRGLRWCAAALVLVGASGAVTALGDTLFPVSPYAEAAGWLSRVREDLGPGAHFLVRLRLWHPVFAVTTAVFLLVVFGKVREHAAGAPRRFAGWGTALLLVQLVLGSLNVLLYAPGWLQLGHLLTAQLLWCALCLVALPPPQRAA